MSTTETIKPSRPAITHEMRLQAAQKLVERERWDSEQAEELAQASEHEPHADGYELAKYLENNYYWDISVSDVEALDCMDTEVRCLHEAACKAWVLEHDIQPPLPIGTMTTLGFISGVCDHTAATYLIKEHGCTRPGRYRLMKFEDAKATTPT